MKRFGTYLSQHTMLFVVVLFAVAVVSSAAGLFISQQSLKAYRYIQANFATATRPAPPAEASTAQAIADTTPTKPTVVLTAPGDPRNCGAHVSAESSNGTGEGGCFLSDNTNTVYVSQGLLERPDALKYVVLHESAHAYQYVETGRTDECDADRLALQWGADASQTFYLNDKGECTSGAF